MVPVVVLYLWRRRPFYTPQEKEAVRPDPHPRTEHEQEVAAVKAATGDSHTRAIL